MVPPVDATITGATDQSEYVTEAWRWFWMRGRRPVVSRSMRRWDRGLALGATGTLLRWNGTMHTGWSNWILHRKLKYYICWLRDVILKCRKRSLKQHNNTSISGVKSSWTSLYISKSLQTTSFVEVHATRHDSCENDSVSVLETLVTQGVWKGPSIGSRTRGNIFTTLNSRLNFK